MQCTPLYARYCALIYARTLLNGTGISRNKKKKQIIDKKKKKDCNREREMER